MTTADLDDMADRVKRQLRRVKTPAVAAIDLQIEQGRRRPAGFEVRRRVSVRGGVQPAAVAASEIADFSGGIPTSAGLRMGRLPPIGRVAQNLPLLLHCILIDPSFEDQP